MEVRRVQVVRYLRVSPPSHRRMGQITRAQDRIIGFKGKNIRGHDAISKELYKSYLS